MGKKEEYPVLLKSIEGWTIRFEKNEVIAAVNKKLEYLESELERLSVVDNWQRHIRDSEHTNATELAKAIHDARFGAHQLSSFNTEIERCRARLRELDQSKEKTCSLNRKQMELFGEFLDIPNVLRKAADEIEDYYKT